MENISIVVYEDNESYRDFLCQILKFEPGFELKGAFSNCLKCVEQIGNLMPYIVLMDLKMPNDGDGIEGLKKLNAAYPDICVIMLTDSVKQQDIFNAIQAQPSGYITCSAMALTGVARRASRILPTMIGSGVVSRR